jgi:hypothetical protein
MTPSRLRAPKRRNVLTLKHGRGKVHERDCPRFDRPDVDRNAYHTVRADQVANRDHCSLCQPAIPTRKNLRLGIRPRPLT